MIKSGGWSLHYGISNLVKETPERTLAPSTMQGHSEKMALHEPAREPSPDTKSAST